MTTTDGDTGPLLFARFAYPPNALGYCGADAPDQLLAGAGGQVPGDRLRALAATFGGAWPYLELIARTHGLADPLDPRVVEAYWVGNRLLDGLSIAGAPGARPHHNFHVLCVYPWAGLLGAPAGRTALQVLDRCRIRWGRVQRTDGMSADITSRALRWDGIGLSLGAVRTENVLVTERGLALADGLAPGDLVACHWGWACHRLTPGQARRLRVETSLQLAYVNQRIAPHG